MEYPRKQKPDPKKFENSEINLKNFAQPAKKNRISLKKFTILLTLILTPTFFSPEIPFSTENFFIHTGHNGELAARTTGNRTGFRNTTTRKKRRRRKGTGKKYYVYYKVKKGDNLSRIAARFKTSTKVLTRLNRIKRNATLPIGKTLKVGLRKKRGKSNWKARPRYTEKHAWHTLSVGSALTRVLLPYNFRKPEATSLSFRGDRYRVKIYAHRFARGNAAYLEILPLKGKSFPRTYKFKAAFGRSYIPLTRESWGFKGLFALAPGLKPGKYNLGIRLTAPGYNRGKSYRVSIGNTKFTTFTRHIYLGDFDKKKRQKAKAAAKPLTQKERQAKAERVRKWKEKRRKRRELIRASTAYKKIVFAKNTGDKLNSALAHPRGLHKVTSPFFTKRRTVHYYKKGGKKRYKKPYERYHKGLDLRGMPGKPIYSMARGRVVCARRMYFEGNFVVIDHGNQIFSGYMHQSRMLVREGQMVSAGQLIGKSGSTGRVRGPHLHLSLWIRGVPVEPLSLLALPIR